MSLNDKTNTLQFGEEYGDNSQRWQAVSAGYAAEPDLQHSENIQMAMNDNLRTGEQRSAAVVQTDQGDDVQQANVVTADTVQKPISRTQEPGSAQVDYTKHLILIVDDDFDTRTMYASVFSAAGFNVVEAQDGLEGLDLATKHRPDVIFTGIIMPRMDGFTMVEALKKNAAFSTTPIVINSHLGRTQDKERAKELHIKDFIVRDYTAPREVVDRITALLVTMEYSIPFDPHADYAKDIIADIGGLEALSCDDPKLILRLSDAHEKTFTAKLECE